MRVLSSLSALAPVSLILFGIGCRSSEASPKESTSSLVETSSSTAATEVILAPPAIQSALAAPVAAPEGPPKGMSAIPAGFFLMGSPRLLGNPEERPMHERVVEAFYMDQTEVTLGAYHACVNEGQCRRPRSDEVFCTEKEKDAEDHPVNCVTFDDAKSFCTWRKARLPNETEWEYAASGGGENRKFSWGNDDPTQKTACFDRPGTCKVASFPAGAFGLYDMSGNVWEWTDSWFGMFPKEPTTGTEKMFKGGSFSRRWPKWLRVRNRSHWKPTESNAWLGFRCAVTKLPLECPKDAKIEGDHCVRDTGTPLCEPNMGWNGKACTMLGADGKPVPGDTPMPADSTGLPGADDEPISVARTPGDDGDCAKNYFHKPNAYRWIGNTWDNRIKLVAARGCTRRDNAPTWVSACCPS